MKVKAAWGLTDIQPFNNTQKPIPKTTKNSESAKIFTKNDNSGNEKLSSVIAQAGYSSRISTLQYLPSGGATGSDGTLLGPQSERDKGKKTLVLDLDETLVHSSFKPILKADIVMPITIENIHSNVYVLVRPGTYNFLE